MQMPKHSTIVFQYFHNFNFSRTIKEQIISECLTQSPTVWRIEMPWLTLEGCGDMGGAWQCLPEERKWIEISKQNIRLNLENFSIKSIIVENGNKIFLKISFQPPPSPKQLLGRHLLQHHVSSSYLSHTAFAWESREFVKLISLFKL